MEKSDERHVIFYKHGSFGLLPNKTFDQEKSELLRVCDDGYIAIYDIETNCEFVNSK